MSRWIPVTLPAFGRADRRPEIPSAVYRRRIAATVDKMAAAGIDVLVVYGDREHFANLAYLTGFDPRFEEALLVVTADGAARLLVGNECAGFLPDPEIGITWELFQELSLPGQPRDASRSLRTIFRQAGIGSGTRVGCVGWKSFGGALLDDPAHAIEIPAYLVDLLRDLTGSAATVRNANDLFIDPQHGLRLHNEPEQIALYEYASTRTSDGVLASLRHLRGGVAEYALEEHLRADGLTLSCHRMVSFGAKAKRGLASPSDNTARLGDPFTIGFGLTGALTCRAGCVAASPADLPAADRDFYDAFARNYADVAAAWYRKLRIGASGGEVFAAVESVRDRALYRFALNPGHYLHLDEWVNSPFSAASPITLASSVALQLDIIPVSTGAFCYVNVEDGVVLADVELRARLHRDWPGVWDRITRRRDFMRDALGIELDASVLPLSNIPGWLPPYALELGRALVQ